MAYEIFLLPVPAGADPEEAGEALLARLGDAAERAEPLPPESAASALVSALRATDAAVVSAPEREHGGDAARPVAVTDLRAGSGIEVTVARTFARFRVPFEHRGDDAAAVFERLFRLLAAGAAATGWSAYDPQEAEGVPADDAGREQTLEIYLSVMDQIGPPESSATAAVGRIRRPSW